MVRINRAMLTGDVRIGAVVAALYVSFHYFLIGTYRVVSYTQPPRCEARPNGLLVPSPSRNPDLLRLCASKVLRRRNVWLDPYRLRTAIRPICRNTL